MAVTSKLNESVNKDLGPVKQDVKRRIYAGGLLLYC